MEILPRRMSKYGLTVHPEESRLLMLDLAFPSDPFAR